MQISAFSYTIVPPYASIWIESIPQNLNGHKIQQCHMVSWTCAWWSCFVIWFIEDSIAAKKRRISFALPIVSSQQSWASEFNLDGKVERSQEEVGDGTSSRVYVALLCFFSKASMKTCIIWIPEENFGLIGLLIWKLFDQLHSNVNKARTAFP